MYNCLCIEGVKSAVAVGYDNMFFFILSVIGTTTIANTQLCTIYMFDGLHNSLTKYLFNKKNNLSQKL